MFRGLRNFVAGMRLAAATGRRDHHRVIALAIELEKSEPDLMVWQTLKAQALKRIGEEEKAAATWRRILVKEPDNFEALTELTSYYLGRNQVIVACEAIRRALQVQDTTPDLSGSERLFLRIAGRFLRKGIERSADASTARRRRWESHWREWAEEFIATHGSSPSIDEIVH